MYSIKVRNIVSVGSLKIPIDLTLLHKHIGGKYSPNLFPGLRYECRGRKVLVFRSGKVVISGTRTTQEGNEVFDAFRDDIKELYKTPDAELAVKNIVSTAQLGRNIQLDKIPEHFPGAKYDVEWFSGAVIHMEDPKVCVSVFSNGNVNVLGATNGNDIGKALAILDRELKSAGT